MNLNPLMGNGNKGPRWKDKQISIVCFDKYKGYIDSPKTGDQRSKNRKATDKSDTFVFPEVRSPKKKTTWLESSVPNISSLSLKKSGSSSMIKVGNFQYISNEELENFYSNIQKKMKEHPFNVNKL